MLFSKQSMEAKLKITTTTAKKCDITFNFISLQIPKARHCEFQKKSQKTIGTM